MIFAQIKPLKNEVIPQVSTYWEVATDETFRNIIETKTTQGDSLYFFSSELTVPEMSHYYVRATRQYDNPDANITVDPKQVSNVDTLITNNIIHRDDVFVERPYIYVNETEFKNPDFPDFEVKTSSFRCKQDGHVATNWIVTDLDGNVIMKSLYDKYDKTSKRFDKTNDILNKTSVIFYVSHVTTNGIESEVCKFILSNDDFNFDVIGLFSDIPPYQDLELFVEPISAMNTDISSIWLKKVNGNGDISRSIPVTPPKGSGTITIPGEELSYGSQLYLDVYCINSNREQTFKRYKLSVQKVSYSNLIVPHTYEKKFEEYDPNRYRSLSLPNNFVVEELPNGNILIPSRAGGSLSPNIYRTSYRSSNSGPIVEIDFSDQGKQADIVLSSNLIDGTIFKVLNDTILLVENSKEISGVPYPSFKVYSYDVVNNVFSLQHEQTRTDETTPLGTQNGLIQVARDKVWYMPVGRNVIKEYDFINNTITEIINLQGDFRLGTMFYNRKVGKMVLINSTGNMSTVEVDTLNVEETVDVPFTDWKGQRLKTIELINGDVLIINQTDMSKTSSMVYYNSLDNTYTELYDTPNTTFYHVGVIVTRSFSVYVVNKETGGNQRFLISRLY